MVAAAKEAQARPNQDKNFRRDGDWGAPGLGAAAAGAGLGLTGDAAACGAAGCAAGIPSPFVILEYSPNIKTSRFARARFFVRYRDIE